MKKTKSKRGRRRSASASAKKSAPAKAPKSNAPKSSAPSKLKTSGAKSSTPKASAPPTVKAPRSQPGRPRLPPAVQFARNPGVGALMLVNPSSQPAQGELFPMSKPEPKEKPKTKTKRGRSRHARSASKKPARPAPSAATPRAASTRKAPPSSYLEMLAREHNSRAKDPRRGLSTLERDRRSMLWNAKYGTPAAREWLKKHVPQLNPDGGMFKNLALGLAAYLGARVLGNLMARLPLVNRLGSHAPVLTSAAVAGATWLLLRKKPELRNPLVFGASCAVVDALVRDLTTMIPALSFLGEAPSEPALEPYEPVGYLADDEDDLGDFGCVPEGQSGFEVSEAMADTGDGLEFEVSEAQAGVDGFDGYVADPAMSGYVPTGEGVSGVDGFEGYDDEAIGAWREFFAQAQGARRQGRRVQTRPMLLRRQGKNGPEYISVNVICPPWQGRRRRRVQPSMVAQNAGGKLSPAHVATTAVSPPPQVRALPSVTQTAVSGLADHPGGIFASDDE